jgi:acid phosphatase family membrane protein YuiD
MNWLIDLLTNQYLLVSLSSWFVAQVLKTVLYALETKKLDWSRLFGDGGMPSGHSATVTSLSVFCGLNFGFDSFQFAATAILAIVVCHDAMGVRLETGKQAVKINELLEVFELLHPDKISEANLKEFVGHTPIQVIAGILLGVANACVMHFWVFG